MREDVGTERAQLGSCAVEAFLRTSADRDACAEFGEGLSDSKIDAAAAARHEDSLLREEILGQNLRDIHLACFARAPHFTACLRYGR